LDLLRDIVCSRINFRNCDFLGVAGVGGVQLGEFFIFWCKTGNQ
jgi:hypothetical protein